MGTRYEQLIIKFKTINKLNPKLVTNNKHHRHFKEGKQPHPQGCLGHKIKNNRTRTSAIIYHLIRKIKQQEIDFSNNFTQTV